MSFDLDDPLAGILSDGSDDSFFDDDILGKKKPAKKKVSTPIMEKKKSLFDLKEEDKPVESLQSRKNSLFDLTTDSKKPPTQTEYETTKTDVPKSTFTRTLSKESIRTPILEPKNRSLVKSDSLNSPAKKASSSADKLDFAEPKKETLKSLERGKSSQSLFDDILGPPTKPVGPTSQIRPATAAKSQDFDLESILGKSESKITIASTKTASSAKTVVPQQKPPAKADRPQEDTTVTRSVKKAKASEDWLGLFQDKEDNDQDDNGMPAWLGGGRDNKKKKSEQENIDGPQKIEKEKVDKPKVSKLEPEHPQITEQIIHFNPGMPSSTLLPLQGSNEDITTEGANLYLQQQESQLMLALQLKAQEEKLAAMQLRQKETQRVQREAALAHHSQLDSMLQRQAQQRQHMQALIAAHQERISERIKALLGSQQNIDENEDQLDDDVRAERKETPHMKEKKQLLQLVQSLQENHDKEIDIMETSYRRQLAFLEVSINQSEDRMKEESDKLLKFYMEKISWLEEHHQLHKKLTEDNLNSMADQHKAENEMLRQQHFENIRVLQEHHATLMDNIRTAMKQEQVLIKDSATFSSDLHELVSDVKENKSQCQTLVDRVQELADRMQRDSERGLQARETQINEMINQLKKERENFESEKNESRDMVKMMETRLKQMTSMIEEDKASLKQKKMELEFEKATFTKQTEFAKNILQKQDEEIKMMKQDIQKEYDDKIAKINEKKTKAVKDSAAIAKEKVSIQNLKEELEKTKAELQAQLEEIMDERSKLNLEKQQTHMEEQRILAKSRDLDLLAKTAIEKQTQADQKYAEAEFIQKKYEDRIRRMQEQSVSLNAREKNIAKEKVALSRERLSLHNERKQLESKMPCCLCKPQNINVPYFESTYNVDTFHAPVSRDDAQANVSSAMNAIESEMAHLMSRNFDLKYATGIGIRNDQLPENVDTESTRVDSGAFKDYMDPKFMMLRLDVQKVLSNLDSAKKEPHENEDDK